MSANGSPHSSGRNISGRSSEHNISGRSSERSEIGLDRTQNELFELCDEENEGNDWEVIHNWFSRYSTREAHLAASYRGRGGKCALHAVCQHNAPLDVVQTLYSANNAAIEWDDDGGWLPLHYACQHGVAEEVLRFLISKYPAGRKTTDHKGRNPLHFAVGNQRKGLFQSSVFTSLAESGAVKAADKRGMCPLHYACAYGASLNTLEVLIEAHPRALELTDINGFLPLHYAMSNCARADCVAVVDTLLKKHPGVENIDFELKQHPLYVLASRAKKLKGKEEVKTGQRNALKCLNLFLDLGPAPTTNFFAALHTLPQWLLEKAVVHPKIQECLNYKISKRFPTVVMMLDFYALLTVLISFAFVVIESIDLRSDENLEDGVNSSKLAPLYLCAIFFAVREIIQVLSFVHLGLFSVWYRRGTNWIEIGLIVLILFWAVVLTQGVMPLDTFRTTAALTTFFFWLTFLNFLRGLLVEFAVFVSGVLHVVQRLGPFLLALIIILFAFMQIFNTIFLETGYCNGYDEDNTFVDTCDPESSEAYRFCSNWRTFLSVYTMLLGEVDEADFDTSRFATFLYVVFVFVVVILLATVLIAIVTDSYSVIRNERAAIVFWSNRLDFIVEMDVISNGLLKKLSGAEERETKDAINVSVSKSSQLWKSILDIFDKDINRMEFWSLAFLCLTLIRLSIIFVVMPMWIALGLLTAGSAWPIQWRKRLLEQKLTDHNKSFIAKSANQIRELQVLKDDIISLQEGVAAQLADNQSVVDTLKADLDAFKSDVSAELIEIHGILTALFDTQKKMYS